VEGEYDDLERLVGLERHRARKVGFVVCVEVLEQVQELRVEGDEIWGRETRFEFSRTDRITSSDRYSFVVRSLRSLADTPTSDGCPKMAS
jgi:hypothetical protein